MILLTGEEILKIRDMELVNNWGISGAIKEGAKAQLKKVDRELARLEDVLGLGSSIGAGIRHLRSLRQALLEETK